MANNSQHDVLSQLRNQLHEMGSHQNAGRAENRDRGQVSLLEHCFQQGTLVQWISQGPGSSAVSLVLAGLIQSQLEGEEARLIVIDPRCEFYFPAAAQLGWSSRNLFLIRPQSNSDALWATEQSLRSVGVTAVLCCGLSIPNSARGTVHRRFQVAAQSGGTIGMLFNDCHAGIENRWADIRLKVSPIPQTDHNPNRRITIAKIGGRATGSLSGIGASGEVNVSLDELTGKLTDEQDCLPLSSAVADSAFTTRKARA